MAEQRPTGAPDWLWPARRQRARFKLDSDIRVVIHEVRGDGRMVIFEGGYGLNPAWTVDIFLRHWEADNG